jgi:hypothetical protein
MSSDLRRAGYRRATVFEIYGFNLLLLHVNLVGTGQSIVQAIGGQKIAFARTPKIRSHTVAPLLFVIMPLLLMAWSGRTLLRDIDNRAYIHGTFAGLNLVLSAYACMVLVGLRAIAVDIAINLREFVYKPVKSKPSEAEVPHWASVIYVGSSVPEETERSASLAVALAAQDQFGLGANPSPAATMLGALGTVATAAERKAGREKRQAGPEKLNLRGKLARSANEVELDHLIAHERETDTHQGVGRPGLETT